MVAHPHFDEAALLERKLREEGYYVAIKYDGEWATLDGDFDAAQLRRIADAMDARATSKEKG